MWIYAFIQYKQWLKCWSLYVSSIGEKRQSREAPANFFLARLYEGKCNISDRSLLGSSERASSFHSCAFRRVGGRGLSWGEGGSSGSKERPRLLLQSHCPAHHFLLLVPQMSFQPRCWLSASAIPESNILLVVSSSLIRFRLSLQCFVLGLVCHCFIFPQIKNTSNITLCHTLKWQLISRKCYILCLTIYVVVLKTFGNKQPPKDLLKLRK